MKLMHISDLHIGKRVNEYSMIEDQKYILKKILVCIEEEKPDGLIIAGDVYDKSVPSAEAVEVLDDFLVRIVKLKLKTFIISGNHDSPERLAFANRIVKNQGIYISSVFGAETEVIQLSDSYGAVNIFLLPFIKPAHVRSVFPDEQIANYSEAVEVAIKHMDINQDDRNILVTHQFVTGSTSCDSEDISVGGTDNVDLQVFQDFDYVALGHLHSPQKVGRETIRYCGTPLKYSFSESKHSKSITVIEMKEKGVVNIDTVPLIPLRDLREIKGSYLEVTEQSFYKDMNVEDYLHITLTDEEDIPNAIGKLRVIYPNIMKLDYDNKRTQTTNVIDGTMDIERKSPLELFAEFYVEQNNQEMTSEQEAFMLELIEQVWEA